MVAILQPLAWVYSVSSVFQGQKVSEELQVSFQREQVEPALWV